MGSHPAQGEPTGRKKGRKGEHEGIALALAETGARVLAITIFPAEGKVRRMWVERGDCYSVNLPDLELAVGSRCSPVDLLAILLASLLSMHRVPWRLDT